MQELSPLTPSSRIFVAGHRGPVGAAIVRRLEKSGYLNLILASRDDLDLRDQAATLPASPILCPRWVENG